MNEALILQHPLEQLKIYDPQKRDALGLPELFLAEDSTVTPYMPPLININLVDKIRVETLENDRHRFFFKLSHEADDILQVLFENYRNGMDVTFEGDILILGCEPRELSDRYDEVCNALFRATSDYCAERRKLISQVLVKMDEQARRDRAEAEIQTERENYQQKRRERMRVAEENGWSVPFVCQNFNSHYREIIENKFKWWSRILDVSTIGKYRAMFEFDFLSV